MTVGELKSFLNDQRNELEVVLALIEGEFLMMCYEVYLSMSRGSPDSVYITTDLGTAKRLGYLLSASPAPRPTEASTALAVIDSKGHAGAIIKR
jgi:hypothetical protein